MWRRGGCTVAAASRFTTPMVVHQSVVTGRRQHGLVVVEAGWWSEHQAYKNRKTTRY